MPKTIVASEKIHEVLFNASLSRPMRMVEEQEDKYGIKLKVEKSVDEVPHEIGLITEEVQVGRPQVFSLLELYELENVGVPAAIQSLSKDYDFFLAELACSLSPKKNDEFVNLKFKIDLGWIGNDGSMESLDQPIAYDLYPVQVFEEVKEKRSIGINPSLKFKSIELGSGGFLAEIAFTRLVPITTDSGLLCPSVVWSFERTKNRKLLGIRRMYLLIKAPKLDQPVVGRIRVFGEIERDRWLFWIYDPIEYVVDLENCVLTKP